jgi:hypothetical protein
MLILDRPAVPKQFRPLRMTATTETPTKPSRALTTPITYPPTKPSRSRPAATRCAPRLASLGCGAYVVGAGSRPLALRFRQVRGSSRLAAPLPFPGSRGLASARHALPAEEWLVGQPVPSPGSARAPPRARSRATRGDRALHGAYVGRVGDTATPWNHHGRTWPNGQQGGTERGRSLDEARRR